MGYNNESARAAAAIIRASWQSGQRLEQPPESCRPRTLAEGHAAQGMLGAE
jgi:hypothetical protein